MTATRKTALTVSGLCIAGTTGPNRRPHSGTAIFSDGKAFDFMINQMNGEWMFFTRMRMPCGGSTPKFFRSPVRAAALSAHLN